MVMALTAARAATATLPVASEKKSASGSFLPAMSRNSPRCRPAKSCRSWPVQLLRRSLRLRVRAQLLPCAPRPRPGPLAWPSQTTTGTAHRATAQGGRAELGLELGHHLPAHHRARCVAVPLSDARRLEPEGCGLGCRRSRGSSHRSGSSEQGFPVRAVLLRRRLRLQQRPPPAVDPACR